MQSVCIAGVSGWVGLSLAPVILDSEDLTLSGAVSRTYAGRSLRDAFAIDSDVLVSISVTNALGSPTGVLIDFTAPNVVRANVMTAIERGVNVIIGTSGLTDDDYEQIDNRARECGVGVLAAGNFALTAVLLQRFAAIAARYIPQWEIIDYAHHDKVDAPSGTARELAYRLSAVGAPEIGIPLNEVHGIRESRGATVQQTQIHSVRSPGYVHRC